MVWKLWILGFTLFKYYNTSYLGVTITLAHLTLVHFNFKPIEILLNHSCSHILCLSFTGIQIYEYIHAPFSFLMAFMVRLFPIDGFHGFHVLMEQYL